MKWFATSACSPIAVGLSPSLSKLRTTTLQQPSGSRDTRCGAKVVNFLGFVKRLRGIFARDVEETQGFAGDPKLPQKVVSGKKPVRADQGLGRGETRRSRVQPLCAASHHMISPAGATDTLSQAFCRPYRAFSLIRSCCRGSATLHPCLNPWRPYRASSKNSRTALMWAPESLCGFGINPRGITS